MPTTFDLLQANAKIATAVENMEGIITDLASARGFLSTYGMYIDKEIREYNNLSPHALHQFIKYLEHIKEMVDLVHGDSLNIFGETGDMLGQLNELQNRIMLKDIDFDEYEE
jgi:hypothetical protein